MLNNKSIEKKGDRWFLFFPLFLSIFGLLMIFDASCFSALRDFGDKFYYFKHQAVWLIVGLVVFFIFSRLDYKILKKFSTGIFSLNFLMLILVLLPKIGKEIYGGRRWIEISGFTVQPSEFIKLSLIIYLSTLLEKRKNFFVFLSLIGSILFLLILEPDLGTAGIVILTALSLYFVSGSSIKELLWTFALFLLTIPLLVVKSPYRKNRLLTFFNSSFDPKGISYHMRQVLIALGSGGILGKGLGQSKQKFLFLPEVTTDSIFAVIAEETGFLGSLVLICAFVVYFYKGIQLSLTIKDRFGQILCFGIIFCLGLQTVINLGAMVALFPLTGVPLPFISYGGSSLLVSLAGAGIVNNIYKNNKLSS